MKHIGMLVCSLLFPGVCPCADPGADLDWPTYGGNAASQKYSAAAQINAGNVGSLAVAWTWDSPDNPMVSNEPALTPWTYKVTPLKVGSQLFVSTSLGFVVALDAATGKENWRFDTGAHQRGRPTNLGFNHRGVAYWSDGPSARILMPIAARRQLNDLPDEFWTKISIEFYKDSADAVFKALDDK